MRCTAIDGAVKRRQPGQHPGNAAYGQPAQYRVDDQIKFHVLYLDYRMGAASPEEYSSVRFMEDRAVNIGPKLFRCECAEIQQGVGQPALSDFGPGAILGRVVGG